MKAKIRALSPGARFTRLAAPPVCGAVLLGMELNGDRTRDAWERLNSWRLPGEV